MTTLNVTLTPAMQAELDQPGVWEEAVYFNAGGTAEWTPLVSNGVVQDGGTVDITLPTPFNSGKVYFLTQSLASGAPASDQIQNAITSQSQINSGNAGSLDFGYDSFEVSLTNQPGDAGNLTSVNGFGLPMAISVANGQSETSVGYGVSGATIVSDISALHASAILTFDQGALSGAFRMAMSPTAAVGTGATINSFSTSDWTNYIASLEGPQAASIELSGIYNGGTDAGGAWHEGGYFAYQLQWNSADGAFWLDPLPGSQIQGDIAITPAQLANSIYSTLGTVNIYAPGAGGPQLFLGNMNTGANTQWGKVLADFLTGFTAGFYDNGGGRPLNPQITSTVDLNTNINWNPTYAFENDLAGTPPASVTYDPYSKIFFDDSNSYGSGYSDALMQQYAVGGPLLSMWNGTSDVSGIDLTIFASGDAPAGYTPPAIHAYIAPAPTGYVVPTDTTSGANIKLSFLASVADNAGVDLAATATITLNVLTSDTGAGGSLAPTWTTVTFDGATAGAAGLWQNWALTPNGSGGYTAAPAVPPVSQPAGSLLITGLPIADNGVSWYQIGVGGKTFNLYTTSDNGAFENPAYTGANQQNALAVDGLAVITPQSSSAQTITTFTVNFASAQAITYAPSLMAPVAAGDTNTPTPSAPVAGVVTGGTFTALAGQTNLASNTIATGSQGLAFAWTGENDAANTSSWISGYTNKINGLDIARVSITPVGGGNAVTTTATASIDGEWHTGTVDLAKGTYDVTMTEYAPTDTNFTTPLTYASTPLVLTETTAPPPCFAAGTPIRTVAGDVPVERLTAGTVLPTAAGRGTARVIWIGHRTVDCRRHPRPESVMPVRVCRDAFAPGRPQTDLLLSPDHAVFVEGVLIPVRHLVNGATIRREPCDLVTYVHVELDRHDVILAAGLAVESYLDTGNRDGFANGGTATRRPSAFARRVWATAACAPLVLRGKRLHAVRRDLLARAGACGHTTTAASDLTLLADDQVLAAVTDGRGWHARLPAGTQTLRLTSRIWCPGEMAPDATDQRALGVAVTRLCLDGRAASLASPGLCAGWHAPEAGWRWTDGNGMLAVAGVRELAFALAMTGTYWQAEG